MLPRRHWLRSPTALECAVRWLYSTGNKLVRTSRPVIGVKREWARTTLTFAAFLLLATIQAFAADARRVLLLHAFGHPYSPWSDMAGSFRAELVKKSPEPIDLYEVSLDTAHVKGPQDEGPFVEYIRALVAGRKLDLIVPVGAPAAFFMERHRSELFPATPMMIVGADLRRIPGAKLTDNDTGVLLDLDLPAYLKNILQLLPETTDVAVVVGNSPVERYWTSELHRDFEQFTDRVKIEWFNDLTFNEMLQRAASMPQHSVIFWFLLSEDAAGVPYAQDRALEQLREVSAVPVFAMGDYEFGRGIIGGPLMQTQALGVEAAAVALRILKGETPGSIDPAARPVRRPDVRLARTAALEHQREFGCRPTPSCNFVSRARGSSIAGRSRSLRRVLAAQTFLIVYVLIQSRRRRAAETEAAEQRHEVAHLMRVSVLGELSGTIAHEINQPLTAILSNAQAALHLLAQKSPDLEEVRDAINDIVHEDNRAGDVIARVRNLLRKGERKSEPVDLNELVTSTIALLNSELIRRRIEVETDLAGRAAGDIRRSGPVAAGAAQSCS